MKKLFNKLSSSGKVEPDTLREDTYSDEEHLDTHYRKSSSLPADAKDTSQDIKAKKSFSGSGGVSRSGSVGKANKDYDFAKKKSSSSGIKAQNKDKDKEKLNESDDKALRKSSSRKKSMSKSGEVKDPDCMKSPALKSVFVSEYEKRDASVESDESSDDEVPRSRGNSMNDDDREYPTTTPIRVPSAPARMASSPIHAHASSPARAAPSPTRMASPRMDSPPKSFTASPPQAAYSPQVQYGVSSPLPRSVSSPSPIPSSASKPVVVVDDFDLRFGGGEGRGRTDSITDDYEKLGKDFSRDRADSAAEDAEIVDNGETTNQKGKSGLFSFGNNKAKKLK